jgi:hypothetical protein
VVSRLLADVADRTAPTAQLGEELAGLRKPRARHDPGRVLVDMAVAVADGATTISDVAVLADQGALFGAVASDSTCWRLLDHLDTVQLGAIARARAAAREVVWAQRAELSGAPFPPARAAGRELRGLVIDLDASIEVRDRAIDDCPARPAQLSAPSDLQVGLVHEPAIPADAGSVGLRRSTPV